MDQAADRRRTVWLSHDNSRGDRRGTHKLELPPYGYAWYRVGGLNDLQTREPK